MWGKPKIKDRFKLGPSPDSRVMTRIFFLEIGRTPGCNSSPTQRLLAHGPHILATIEVIERGRMLSADTINLSLRGTVCLRIRDGTEHKGGQCRCRRIGPRFKPAKSQHLSP
jgi:hypothetical protein